jgi:hypothetical protein
MRRPAIALIVVIAVAVALAGGYWLGFRHAWNLGLMAEAPVRGTLAIGHLRLLEKGRVSDLRTFYESDIDSGLLWWSRLEDDPMFRFINALSGHDVIPNYEQYVTRVAAYRKANKSPLREQLRVESMLNSVREKDPGFAKELEQSGRQGDLAIDRMVRKYAQ